MALTLLVALALALGEPPTTSEAPAADPAATHAPKADGSVGEKIPTREEMEDAIPEGAPKDDYEFVAWCHGALAGQIELDPIVEKDMDAIEGKAAAAKRKAGDAEIAAQHKKYLALYEKALSAAEKASPTAIHEEGVEAELQGYKIWGPTKNKAAVWRMVDWGNWEVPPHCQKAAQRLYEKSSLLGAALKDAPAAETPAKVTDPAPAPAQDVAASAPKDTAKP
jgi:hypothetical protein